MAPAPDTVVIEYVDRLRDRALDGKVDAIDLLATLAADLLIACRAAQLTAPKSCADAVDILNQVLARHMLLPASEKVENGCWLLIDVDGSGHLEIERDDDRQDPAFTDGDAMRLARAEARQGSLPAIRAVASHQRHKAAIRGIRRSST